MRFQREEIWDSPEYNLAPEDARRWASSHPGNYKNPIDAAEEMGVKTKNRTVKVKLNTGEMYDVPVVASFYSIEPSKTFKQVRTHVNGKFQVVYLVKGSYWKNPSAKYFTSDDFENSEDLKAFEKEIQDGFKKYQKQHAEMLKDKLAKTHSAMAKKAQAELPALVKNKNDTEAAAEVFNWFKKNKFDMPGVNPDSFVEFAKKLKRTGNVSYHFKVFERPDGFGHREGESCQIDFVNKRIRIERWSSDD